jgi:hypothetical protein
VLDDDLLAEFIAGFFGYGNLHAPLWYVGMEEGGGSTVHEIQTRLDIWATRGRPVADDIAEFHRGIGQSKWFIPGAATQSTWRPIIRSILLAKGRTDSLDSIRAYQIEKFARAAGEVASLELMPLPAPSTNASDWRYGEWSRCPDLTDRRTYLRRLVPARIARLQALILQHKPRAVVFYGASYQAYWESLSNCAFGSVEFPRLATRGSTTFLVLPHPTAGPPASGAARFAAAGQILKTLLVH